MCRTLVIPVILTMLFLQGCMAGSGISHILDNKPIKCGDVTRFSPQSSSISGWQVPYYIVPLWYHGWDDSKENLKVEFYFQVEVNNRDYLSNDDLYLLRSESERQIRPISTKLTSNNGHGTTRFLMYQSEFGIESGQLEEFEIIFKREIYGCNISPIKYKKSKYNSNQTNL